MNELEEQKLKAELRLLEEERKAVIVRTRLDILKGLAVALGAATVFWFIQNPDSILNREVSRDSLARQRAALILDCLKEQDPGRRRQALAVVHAVYGKAKDKWLEAVESALQGKADAEVQAEQAGQKLRNTTDANLQALYRRKKELAGQVSAAYEEALHEADGTAGTRMPGTGQVFKAKYEFVQHLRDEIARTDLEIEQYQALHVGNAR